MTDDKAPGRCADCGDAAYIQMGGDDAFVCAHCFGGRAVRPAEIDAPPSNVPATRAS